MKKILLDSASGAEADSQNTRYDEIVRTDPLLSIIVELVEAQSDEGLKNISITLFVGGFMVTGKLVTFKEYAEGTSFGKFAELLEKEQPDVPISPTTRMHIHLKHAKFLSGAHKPIPDGEGVFWRGRLSEVGGFCHGEIAVG
jgi:hypothetical protein